MDDHTAMLAIQELLDGVEWTPDTFNEIAAIMAKAGYRIRDRKGVDHPTADEAWS